VHRYIDTQAYAPRKERRAKRIFLLFHLDIHGNRYFP
jgi:hypothetical protein